MNTKSLGNRGEQNAAEYLKNKGYTIAACNFRTRYGEIDIIAKDKDVLVFVEVKLRSGKSYGRGIEAISPSKIKKIHQVAMEYIQKEYQSEPACRFDVIEIHDPYKMEILHIENAF